MITNDFEEKKIQVHWFRPTLRTQQKEKSAYHRMHYEGEFSEIVARAQQKGRRRITRDARTDWVDYNTVYFGFSKLNPTGGKHCTYLFKVIFVLHFHIVGVHS